MLLDPGLNPSSNKQRDKSVKKYILIRECLDKNFNPTQWKQITAHTPQTHNRIQKRILDYLISNQELFNKYFTLYYENHVKLYHWYLLARENHHLIKLYLNQRLLSKSIDNYMQQVNSYHLKAMRDKQRQKQNKAREKSKQQEKIFQTVKPYKIDDLSKEIFSFMATKALTASLIVWQKPWSRNKRKPRFESEIQVKQHYNCTQSYQKSKTQTKNQTPKNKKQLQASIDSNFLKNHDFHDLYIQTFHACDGPRYIFYNYEKHMKGLSQKDKYNMFIRTHNKGRFMDMRLTQQSEEQQPIIKQIKSCQVNRFKSAFQYSTYGNAVNQMKKKRAKVVLKRTKIGSCGKFVRKS